MTDWPTEPQAADLPAPLYDHTALTREVWRHVRDHPGPHGVTDLARRLRHSRNGVMNAVRTLVADGLLVRVERGLRVATQLEYLAHPVRSQPLDGERAAAP